MNIFFNFLKTFFLIVLIVDCNAIDSDDYKVIKNLGIKKFKPRRKLIEVLSEKILKYIDLSDSYFIDPDEKISRKDGECDSLDDINNYFLDVYSSQSTKNLTSEELDKLIEFQIHRGSRDDYIEKNTEKKKCNRKNCFSSIDIYNLTKFSTIDINNFAEICPIMLYNNELEHCIIQTGQSSLKKEYIWLFGFLFSGIVTIWSWIGGIFFPIITKKIYKKILMFMISLAFATLTTNGLLKYIPLADGFFDKDIKDRQHSYFFKHITVIVVIFFFFMFERTMKLITIYNTNKKKLEKAKRMDMKNMEKVNDEDKRNSFDLKDSKKIPDQVKKILMKSQQSIDISEINILGMSGLNECTIKLAKSINEEDENCDDNDDSNRKHENSSKINSKTKICCTSLTKGLSDVRPIGWMAIFGDGLSNFIDGLSIGASLNRSLAIGLTTSIATWSSNIPQELGDFALLVRAGMTPFQALFYNYLSSFSAYIGLIIGIVLGEDIAAAKWIFSISGATALYLGLAVLLPEINEDFDGDDKDESIKEKLKTTLIQICGMITGFALMIILNAYEDELSL